VPYADRVKERYAGWLLQQEQAGVTFSDTERWWLDRIVQVIAASAGINAADLDNPPLTENGGTDGAIRDLGDRTAALIEQLHQELTA
jgi:type I restriction enzyme, R subunit